MPAVTGFRQLFASFAISCGRSASGRFMVLVVLNFLRACSERMHRNLPALGGEDSEFDFLFERQCTQRFALVAAEYVESSKTHHRTLMSANVFRCSHEVRRDDPYCLTSALRGSLSIDTSVVKFASVAFEELLQLKQTLNT
jgi:hypothetical protein